MDGGSVTSSPSLSSAAPVKRWNYDVFISFQFEDTQTKNFVDNLYEALYQAGIHAFKDDKKLLRGKPISQELAKAIEKSRFAVAVFSKNYANSSSYLEELAKIIECRDLRRQRVLPVFYDVDRSDVREQKGSFHAAFEQYGLTLVDNMEKVKIWKEALVTASDLSGWDVPLTANGNEAECIKQIVQNILSYTESLLEDNLIGMDSRVEHVKSLLGKGCDAVCIIGIWGMGGIGKTTISRAVYNQISHEFEGSCFVENVRENGSDKRGLKCLQEKLLKEITREDDVEVQDCDDGMYQIQNWLSSTKVLLVLDDVDDIKQLQFLAGAREWFGAGSRIMITTRDENLLSCAQEKYTPDLLKENEAVQLFNMYAFKANIPPKAYAEFSGALVNHTGYHPLALKVLGSHFCGRDLDFWQNELNFLTKLPQAEISGFLKMSFDELSIAEKKILLYIACSLKGRDRRYVTRILDCCGFEAVSGIAKLIQKSFLTISKGCVHMHDLIQEMSREYYPNTIARVTQEIKETMKTISRLEAVEAIVETNHDKSSDRPMPYCSAKVFMGMKKLRLLEVNKFFTSSEPASFPEELRWLCWSDYPYQYLRITRGMTNLVSLQMPYSDIIQVQMERKVILPNLKSMDLNRSYMITSFPDISGVPNLERLNLTCCIQLREVHQSVLNHEKIIHLDLTGCISLRTLPSPIKMKSLQTFILDNCVNLKRLPEVSMETRRLMLLDIIWCDNIKALPLSFGLITSLTVLIMSVLDVTLVIEKNEQGYSKRILPSNLPRQAPTHFSSLRILDLKQNHLAENVLPADIHKAWPSMEELILGQNNFTLLPATISFLSHLKHLDLTECMFLKELPELPSRIQVLKADGCRSLEKIEDLSDKYKWLYKISLRGTPKLLNDQESESHIFNLLMKSVVQSCAAVNHRLSIAVPGSKVSDWFSNQRLGDKVALNIPRSQITKLKGLAVCCLFCASTINSYKFLSINFKATGNEELIDKSARGAKRPDHVWIGYMPVDFLGNLCHGFESEDLIISFKGEYYEIMECGVCAIYEDDIKPVTGNGSWVMDYDELERIDRDSATSEDLQQRRRSLPSFRFGNEITGQQNTINVDS